MREGDVLEGKYHLVREIGEGGQGTVWLAMEQRGTIELGHVAIKRLPRGADASELAKLASLNHPGILRYRTSLVHEDRLCLVTDYADGGDAAAMLRLRGGPLRPEEVRAIVVPLLEALVFLHESGWIHRDVKPANLLFVGGRAVLGDVGLLTEAGGPKRTHRATAAYAAPEQFDGRPVAVSDVYATGVTAFELLAGRLPFDGSDLEIMKAHCTRPVAMPPAIPGPWQAWLARCLEKDAAKRWLSAEALAALVRRPVPPKVAPKAARPPNSQDVAIAVVGAVVESAVKKWLAPKPAITPEVAQAIERLRAGFWESPTPAGYVAIAPGRFWMGASEGDTEASSDESPRHEVTLTRGFLLKSMPVTQAEWRAVMGSNLSAFSGDERPVENVSWDDAIAYCAALSKLEGLDATTGYRLPTEAEWEYACRAGAAGPRYGPLDDAAWHGGNSGKTTHPVGRKAPNAWGLYDMLGNVWEWCSGWYGPYASGPIADPAGPPTGRRRINRGGSWALDGSRARASCRGNWHPDSRYAFLGFRPARTR